MYVSQHPLAGGSNVPHRQSRQIGLSQLDLVVPVQPGRHLREGDIPREEPVQELGWKSVLLQGGYYLIVDHEE